jgi:hypothetical protein
MLHLFPPQYRIKITQNHNVMKLAPGLNRLHHFTPLMKSSLFIFSIRPRLQMHRQSIFIVAGTKQYGTFACPFICATGITERHIGTSLEG